MPNMGRSRQCLRIAENRSRVFPLRTGVSISGVADAKDRLRILLAVERALLHLECTSGDLLNAEHYPVTVRRPQRHCF